MTKSITRSIDACASHYGENANEMREYLLNGEKNALAMNNRGPIEFDEYGDLAQNIKSQYQEYGFYIFENVIDKKELAEIEIELAQLKKPSL